jgi:hypothetical protein
MAFLAAKPFDLGHGDALNSNRGQGLSNFVQLEWLDDRSDQFHDDSPGKGGPLERTTLQSGMKDLEGFTK